MSSKRRNATSILPLPAEIREKIYDDLEPSITIAPQYPVNIHMATATDWRPGYESNPLYGINSIMDKDIKSRYCYIESKTQIPFLPKKTTFSIWYQYKPPMVTQMNKLFVRENIFLGVRHLEYIFDKYGPGCDNQFFASLNHFSLLETLKVVINYGKGNFTRSNASLGKSWLEMMLDKAFPKQGSREVDPYCTYEGEAQNVKWEVRLGALRRNRGGR